MTKSHTRCIFVQRSRNNKQSAKEQPTHSHIHEYICVYIYDIVVPYNVNVFRACGKPGGIRPGRQAIRFGLGRGQHNSRDAAATAAALDVINQLHVAIII